MNKISISSSLKNIIKNNSTFVRLLGILVAVLILIAILKPEMFFRLSTFVSMFKQFPEYGILAIAMSIAIITGGIDLSVVAVANLSAVVAAKYLVTFVSTNSNNNYIFVMIFIAILLALLTGFFTGMFNGLLITKLGIPPMLATIGTWQLFAGITIIITKGTPISKLPIIYSKVVNKTFLDIIPAPLLIFILVALIISFLLSKTSFGIRVYMIGTNPIASKFSGINNSRVLLRVYIIIGLLAALVGLIMMGRVNSAKADYGNPYVMQAILIAVLAGVDPKGGFGKIADITLAILILQSLSTTLNMYEQISNLFRDLIWGSALIIFLIINYYISLYQKMRFISQ